MYHLENIVNREIKVGNGDFKKFKKVALHGIGLLVQRKLRAYFGLQEVTELLLFNVSLKYNVEIQQNGAIEFVYGKKISSSGVSIHAWVDMDIHSSVMTRKKY